MDDKGNVVDLIGAIHTQLERKPIGIIPEGVSVPNAALAAFYDVGADAGVNAFTDVAEELIFDKGVAMAHIVGWAVCQVALEGSESKLMYSYQVGNGIINMHEVAVSGDGAHESWTRIMVLTEKDNAKWIVCHNGKIVFAHGDPGSKLIG